MQYAFRRLEFVYKMKRYALFSEMLPWLDAVQKSNLAYYKIRKNLWSKFTTIVAFKGIGAPGYIEIPSESYNSIWGYLTTRNDKLTSDGLLNFQNVISELIASSPEEDESDSEPSA